MDWNKTLSIDEFFVFNGTLSSNITSSSSSLEVVRPTGAAWPSWYEAGRIQIPFYAVIFVLAVTGNLLVIFTLVKNQRMRTITNLFLLNLAISDLLLGVLCMPFTLIGALLRDFVFGPVMCKLLPFLQACSVSVGVWTLVAISVERYYAICHPLRSLRWQTLSHAYKLILAIWIGSIICMAPIAALSQLQPTRQGNQKCRENWSSVDCEKAYNLFLDAVLLVIPLLVMAVTYSLITMTLCKGMKTEKTTRTNQVQNNGVNVYVNLKGVTSTRSSCRSSFCPHAGRQRLQPDWSQDSGSPVAGSKRPAAGLRRTNAERSLSNKKRIVKMLFAVVLEFFICWTPLYVVNTVALFDASLVYDSIGVTGVSFFQLLAYTSSCCNPITYCFMNLGFRKAFVSLFSCSRRSKGAGLNGSEINMETKWTNRLSEPA
ncbi:unnamed protein product [Phyllotreta striolata]|uniref:G-protein coupled receptors family 1 profile domain-containing protein n=1 Tax=Phyllotreta striolata TaxID=444603 RepID=A0A9N9XK60_PHYSR|nr:unnamed protein product [Phyllotreta striolata]